MVNHIHMKEIFSSIFFLAIAGASVWGWIHWKETKQVAQDQRPSIGALATDPIASAPSKPQEVVTEPSAAEDASAENKKPAEAVNDAVKSTLDVKVMNGGAARGSAVKVQDFLKKNGYTKARVGNAVGDYTGVTVYYLGSNEGNANSVKQALEKDYPNTLVKIATSSSAENGSAPVVVMLGK